MKKLFLLLVPFSLLADIQPIIRFETHPTDWGRIKIDVYVEEQPAGYLEYHQILQTPRIYIDLFYINPDFRNKKIGTALMQEALRQFEVQHCTEVVLCASPFGEGPRLDIITLMNFYKKFGFKTFDQSVPYDATYGGNMHKIIDYQLA